MPPLSPPRRSRWLHRPRSRRPAATSTGPAGPTPRRDRRPRHGRPRRDRRFRRGRQPHRDRRPHHGRPRRRDRQPRRAAPPPRYAPAPPRPARTCSTAPSGRAIAWVAPSGAACAGIGTTPPSARAANVVIRALWIVSIADLFRFGVLACREVSARHRANMFLAAARTGVDRRCAWKCPVAVDAPNSQDAVRKHTGGNPESRRSAARVFRFQGDPLSSHGSAADRAAAP